MKIRHLLVLGSAIMLIPVGNNVALAENRAFNNRHENRLSYEEQPKVHTEYARKRREEMIRNMKLREEEQERLRHIHETENRGIVIHIGLP